jgi:heme A synthase
MPSYLNNVTVLHSILRYFILLFAVIVVVQSLIGMMGNGKFKKMNKQSALALLIFCDLQLVLGLLLYYYHVIAAGVWSSGNVMKDPFNRFYAVEHSFAMVVAIILVHIGYSVTKKNMDDDRKFKRLFWCSFIALGLIMAMIPWEGKQVVGRPNIPHFGS